MRAVFVTGHGVRCSGDSWSHHSYISEQGHACDYEALCQMWIFHLRYIYGGHFDGLVLPSILFCSIAKRPFLCAVCFGAWYLFAKACQWMPCILLSWHSKNCTCSLVRLPYYVSHLRSVLELDVKATCFLFSWQPAVLVVLFSVLIRIFIAVNKQNHHHNSYKEHT